MKDYVFAFLNLNTNSCFTNYWVYYTLYSLNYADHKSFLFIIINFLLIYNIALFCSYNRHQNFEYTVILLVNSITNKGVTPYFRILFSLLEFSIENSICVNRILGVTPKFGIKLYHLQFSAVFPTFWSPL